MCTFVCAHTCHTLCLIYLAKLGQYMHNIYPDKQKKHIFHEQGHMNKRSIIHTNVFRIPLLFVCLFFVVFFVFCWCYFFNTKAESTNIDKHEQTTHWCSDTPCASVRLHIHIYTLAHTVTHTHTHTHKHTHKHTHTHTHTHNVYANISKHKNAECLRVAHKQRRQQEVMILMNKTW